jgi:preprotein translocase SecE subunit
MAQDTDDSTNDEANEKALEAEALLAASSDEGGLSSSQNADPSVMTEPAADEEDEYDDASLPTQIGHRRYVYAAFFVFGIALAYFLSKMGVSAWYRLSQYSPKVGEAREDLVTPVAAIIAAVIVFLVYRRDDVRVLADEVALELSKVEWPTKEMVQRSTSIVVGASLGSSMLFWVYDIGTNKAVTFVTSSQHPLLYGLAAGVGIYLIRALGIRFLVGTER